MSAETKDKSIEGKEDLIRDLLVQNEKLQKELERFRSKVPLVGVRWYGKGGVSLGLTHPIGGYSKVVLRGYGDKGTIDLATWVRVESSDIVKEGVLVRDDAVVTEMAIDGAIADPDKHTNSNSFTDSQIEKFLRGNIKKLNEVLDSCTHHFAPYHFLVVMRNIGLKDAEVQKVVRKRAKEMFVQHNWSLLHHHDLTEAMEINGLEYKGKTDDEMVSELTNMELSTIKDDDFDLE